MATGDIAATTIEVMEAVRDNFENLDPLSGAFSHGEEDLASKSVTSKNDQLRVDNVRSGAQVEQNSEAFILRLPNELLFDVLKDATFPTTKEYHLSICMYRRAHPLLFVCKRFNAVALKLVYKAISYINKRSAPCDEAMRMLHRRLRESPALGLEVHFLNFNMVNYDHTFDDSRRAQWQIIIEIISWLPNLKHFFIDQAYIDAPKGLAIKTILDQIVRSQSRLRRLFFIGCDNFMPYFKQLVGSASFPAINELNIYSSPRRQGEDIDEAAKLPRVRNIPRQSFDHQSPESG